MVICSGYTQNCFWTLKPQLRMLENQGHLLYIGSTHFCNKIFQKIMFGMFQGSILRNRKTVQNED